MKLFNKIYNLKNKVPKEIILISDIHYASKKDIKYLNKLYLKLKELDPEYICIPGDLIDEAYIKDEDILIEWLEKLSQISKVIYSLGNHENCVNKKKKQFGYNKNLLNKISNIKNLYLLDNNNVEIDNINFIGITIPMKYYLEKEVDDKELKDIFHKLKTKKRKYNILLCHSPIDICTSNYLKDSNIDLVLCGHMHGGILPRFLRKIFKNSGIISPERKLFPRNSYGYIKICDTEVIISSGIMVIRQLRNLFVSEIVKIK